jgi:glutathione S-transferase
MESDERPMITIWGRRNSANVVKVLWLCDEIGLTFDRKDVGGPFGGLDTPEFLALNPNGVIPVIEDGDTVVWESHAVLRFLATKYGPAPIYPPEPAARSHVERWLDWHISTLAPAITPVFVGLYRTPPERRNEAELTNQIKRLSATMIWLDRQMENRSYIAGDALTVADIAFGNSIWRWFAFPVERPPTPNLAAWQARVGERPGHIAHIAQPLS